MTAKTLIAAAVALATLLPASGALAANAWTTSALNFREGPSTYSPIVHYLPHCAALTTYEWQNGWVRAEWGGRYGWVSASYISGSNAHCQTGYQPPAYVPPVTRYQPPVYHAPVTRYQPPVYHAPAYAAPARSSY